MEPALCFSKYQAIGNDYLVCTEDVYADLSSAQVQRICDRHFGAGSDGILVWCEKDQGAFRLRIINPDGSEAEKSGNGLRIFARYLFDRGEVKAEPFEVSTPGGLVRCQVLEGGKLVTVDMGRARFRCEEIPVAIAAQPEALDYPLTIAGATLRINAVSVGNPHCVIVRPSASKEEACELGPILETHALFPKRINVQFMQIIDRANIKIEIWERGAGYTLASGSSSCAAACVAKRLGFCDSAITVHMPGGKLAIEISDDYSINMTGPVQRVGEISVVPECLW